MMLPCAAADITETFLHFNSSAHYRHFPTSQSTAPLRRGAARLYRWHVQAVFMLGIVEFSHIGSKRQWRCFRQRFAVGMGQFSSRRWGFLPLPNIQPAVFALNAFAPKESWENMRKNAIYASHSASRPTVELVHLLGISCPWPFVKPFSRWSLSQTILVVSDVTILPKNHMKTDLGHVKPETLLFKCFLHLKRNNGKSLP